MQGVSSTISTPSSIAVPPGARRLSANTIGGTTTKFSPSTAIRKAVREGGAQPGERDLQEGRVQQRAEHRVDQRLERRCRLGRDDADEHADGDRGEVDGDLVAFETLRGGDQHGSNRDRDLAELASEGAAPAPR